MAKFEFTPPKRAIDRVFIHCSASDVKKHDNAAAIKKFHTDPKPKGREWSDIGYHFYIRKSGLIENGRPLSKIPAAQQGHNRGTIAICCGGLLAEKFTEAQFNSLRVICGAINEEYDENVTFHGHCEVANKSCPVFDYRKVLVLDRHGRMPRLEGQRTPPARKPTKQAPEAPKPEPATVEAPVKPKRSLFGWLFGNK